MTTRKQDTLQVVHASPDAAGVSVTLWMRAHEMDGAFYTHWPRTHVWEEEDGEAPKDGWVALGADSSISAWVLTVGDRIVSLVVLPSAGPRVALQMIQKLQARLPTLRVTLTSDGANSSRRNEWVARYQSIGFRVRASSFSSAGAISLAWSLVKEPDIEEQVMAEAIAEATEASKTPLPGQPTRRVALKCEGFDRKAWPVALIRKPPTLTLYHGSPTWAVLQQFVLEVEPKVRRFFASQRSKQARNDNLDWADKSTLAKNLHHFSHQLERGNPNPDVPRLHLNIVVMACIAEFVKRGYTGDLVEGVRALVNTTNAYKKNTHPLLTTAQEFASIGSWDKLVALGKTNVCKLALETQQVLFCGAQATALGYAKKESSFLYTYTLHPNQRADSWFVRLNDPKTLWGMLADGMPFGEHAEEEDNQAGNATTRYKYSPKNLAGRIVRAVGEHAAKLFDRYQKTSPVAPDDEIARVLMPVLLRMHELFRIKEPETLAALARVQKDGLGAHGLVRDTYVEKVLQVDEYYRNTPLVELLQQENEGIASSWEFYWNDWFEVPLSSRRLVWIGMYPDFFCGSGKLISRVSFYEEDAMLVSMFVNSKWYKANKACIIGWFGNSQHEWVVADPQARGVLTKETPGINIAGPIDIFRKFEDYDSYQ
jgi:hypothetical protein